MLIRILRRTQSVSSACLCICVSELLYEDVFAVWEVIWVAPHISSHHFVLFIALALVEVYREIIRDNNMDFTDIIKFFNGEQNVENRGSLGYNRFNLR